MNNFFSGKWDEENLLLDTKVGEEWQDGYVWFLQRRPTKRKKEKKNARHWEQMVKGDTNQPNSYETLIYWLCSEKPREVRYYNIIKINYYYKH